MEKRWNILKAPPGLSDELQAKLNINRTLCDILVNRGITGFDDARDFFRPALNSLHDPWLMKDMDLAVVRILSALTQKEKILIYGDYDVDGTTAVASMYRFLKTMHEPTDFYIPHRYREGYGISKAGIDYAKDHGISLIISLDCGIKSASLIAYAKTLGIDFIVCDHHLPDDELPPAVAILNPKQKDCTYPYKELCGCGVGFKLISALSQKLNLPEETPNEFLDLVATAIAADIVPLTGENRVLAYHGLIKANTNPNPGIQALAKLSGLVKKLHITNLVFMIAPRVNAAGRMDDATKAVQMFIAPTLDEAMHFAEMLHSDNSDRKEADSSTTAEALAQIEAHPDWKLHSSTVVYQPHWHKGVVGIVASRIIEQHYRPTVVLTKSGDIISGSARSVPGFNLYEAIHACREFLLGYGGHFAAAGLSLDPDNLENFRNKFESIVKATIRPELLIPEIIIDAEIPLQEITPSFYSILSQMEPFGPENMRPVFIARRVTDTGWSKIAKEEHIRFSIKQQKTVVTGIGFGMASKFPLLQSKKPVDLVFKIEENEWNGNTNLQLAVMDVRASEA